MAMWLGHINECEVMSISAPRHSYVPASKDDFYRGFRKNA